VVNQTLARRYAVAVDSLARDRGVADRVGSDLTTIAAAIGDEGHVREFFTSPVIGRPEKERLLSAAFEGRVDPVALHTLLLLVRKRREPLLGALVAEYLTLQRRARGAQRLALTSARPLDRGEYAALIGKLERLYGKKFEVTEKVDPKLIGGLRIVIGDRRIDDSIAGRLDTLARDLSTTA
jgi:F-type H+-transporting ATPase subunit delta